MRAATGNGGGFFQKRAFSNVHRAPVRPNGEGFVQGRCDHESPFDGAAGKRGGSSLIPQRWDRNSGPLPHFIILMIHDPKLITLHLAGAFALFLALGATVFGGTGKKMAAALHGISMLVILGVGFAMLQKPPMHQYWWMVKFGLWLFLGAAPMLAKRKVMPGVVLLTLCIAAGAAAAWLGLAKPF